MPQKPKLTKGSITLPPDLRKAGHAYSKQLGLRSFSALMAILLRNALEDPNPNLTILIKRGATKPKPPKED